MQKILIIEDEKSVAELVKKCLTEEGYAVSHAADGLSGVSMLHSEQPDLIILDILLPKMNGLDVCKKIRESSLSAVPILMLTALGSAENVALGLDSGADDYLAKPFKLIELKARIRNLLKRRDVVEPVQQEVIYRFEKVVLNDSAKTVTRTGNQILLTSTEFRLLLMFMKNPNRVISRTDLLDEVWGINFDIGTNVVDVYVNYLRKKLGKYGETKLIHTVVGMGYVLK